MLRTTPVPLIAIAIACVAFAACDDKRARDGSPPIARDQRLTGATVSRTPVAERAGEPEVVRFSDETRMAPTTATLMTDSTRVRKGPGGEPLFVLRGGSEVVEIARAHDHYLIEVAPPNGQGERLRGWVYKDALEAWGPADELTSTGAKTRACARGDVRVQSDHEFCAKPCREDGDCQGPGVCDGEARLVSASGSERARYCVVSESSR